MDDEKEKNINLTKIEEQREELTKWKITLSNYLSKEINEQEEVFVISKYWFDKYEKFIFQENIQNFSASKLFYEYKENNNELFTHFTEKKILIQELPKVFILNKNIWSYIKNECDDLNAITSFGYFANKLLILQIYDLIYCFIFNDKDIIRQGYIEIMKKENEHIIIEEFKKKGYFEFISYKNKIRDDQCKKNEYKIYVFDNIEENKEYDEKEKKCFERKRSKTLSSSIHLGRNKKNELSYIFGEKIFKMEKTGIFKEEQILGGVKPLFSKYLELLLKQKNYESTNLIKLNPNSKPYPNSDPNPVENFNLKQNPFPEQQEQPKLKGLIPGNIGLENIGATCYMNATVQCFSNIERFRGNLLNIYNYLENNKKSKKLSFALAEVFRNLWVNLTKNYYPPIYFKKVIGEMNPLFSGIAANDPKDLILFLLETMHKELNIAKKEKNDYNDNINANNFNEVFNEFIKCFTNNNQSIVCEEFYGCTNSITICGNCKNIIHNVQALNILFFPLEEVRKFMNQSTKIVKIENCFAYYQRQDIYPSFYCNNCNQLYSAYNFNKLIYTPPTLIINLNRGRGIQFDVKIDFGEYLELQNYVYAQDSPNYYELIGVICHIGSNDMGGHFISYCKNSAEYKWYKYNDGIVSESSFNEAKQAALPYVLFYSYIQK